jgi:hypothetical protein
MANRSPVRLSGKIFFAFFLRGKPPFPPIRIVEHRLPCRFQVVLIGLILADWSYSESRTRVFKAMPTPVFRQKTHADSA